MKPIDHAVIDAAVKAKRAQRERSEAPPAPPASTLNKAVTAGIWVAAAGTLAAVFMAN